jgi:hypothetical protein
MGKYVTTSVTLVLSFALAAAVAASAATGPSTIRITDVQVQQRTLDLGPSGRGIGDVETVHVRLYNPSITEKTIGRGDLLCTYIDRRRRTCDGTFSLPRGKLVVSGVISTRLLYVVAVVGGTGLYDNARGMLTVTSTSFRPRHEILLFRLTG